MFEVRQYTHDPITQKGHDSEEFVANFKRVCLATDFANQLVKCGYFVQVFDDENEVVYDISPRD